MLLILVLVLTRAIFASAQDVSCTQEFCGQISGDCPVLQGGCAVPNKTHNGLFLPFPGPCNCCKYCLGNLGKGDKCSMGSPTSTIPTTICGDGLACKSNICQEIDSECTKKQRDYDKRRKTGELGHLEARPNCDRNGLFEPFKCIPGEICHCANEEGERIFGEILETSIPHIILPCRCSRAVDRISKFLGRALQRHERLRCQADGSYDSIQCIDKRCFCVDVLDGTPSHPDMEPVAMTLISEKTLPCFNNNSHIEYDYYHNCEDLYMRKFNHTQSIATDGVEVYGTVYPNCQLDGWYSPVGQNKTNKYCVSPNGDVIENYVVDLNDLKLAEEMNCKCARTSLLVNGPEKPSCCNNGNYNSLQCRRGLCRCVDEDGNQIEKEVPNSKKDTLSCTSCTGN